MNFAIVIFIILSTCYGINCGRKRSAQCMIDIRTDLIRNPTGSVKEPLILKRSGSAYKLMIPEDGILKFKIGESAEVVCTSDQKPNFLTYNNKTSSTITCAAGSKFKANNELERIADLNECHSQITGSVVNYNKNCANNGIKMAIGFQLNDGRGFVKLIDVCYDKQLAALIYTRHIVHGKSIKNAMKSNTRPSGFKTTELPSNVAAPKSYTKASQLKRFDEIFENSTIAEDLLAQTFLARGHSAPDGDFIFVSGQIATYHYINTMPQWQSINNANWKHIENEVRSLAGYMKKECIVYTGGFDVLEINSKRISLEPDGLAAPKWTWKIVKVVADNSGIAFVTFNNPFATQAPTPICKDICDEFGWDWKDRKSIQKGYTICCVITDLVKIHPVIPEEAKASNLINKTWK